MRVDIQAEHVQKQRIFAAPRENDVRMLGVGPDVLVQHGLDRGQILGGDGGHVPTPVADVPLDAPEQAHVRIHLNVHLHVHHLPQAGIEKGVNAFHDHHVGGLDFFAGVRPPVFRVIIALGGNASALLQGRYVRQQRVVFENVGIVVIDLAALLKGQRRLVDIIIILAQVNAAFPQPIRKQLGQGGFSAAACPADTDEKHVFASVCR